MLYHPPSGSTDPNAPYVGKNVAGGIQGSKVPPGAVELPQRELVNLITLSGQTPTDSDPNQVTRAIRGGQLDFDATDTGTADAVSCQIGLAHTQVRAGLPFTFIKGPSSNATATPTLTITDLAGNNGITGTLVKANGKPVSPGDLPGGALVMVRADAAGAFRCTSMAPSDALALQRPITPYTGAVTAGGFYAIDLGTTQVFNLPNPSTLTSGWYVDLLVTGNPSGYQTAYAQIAAGSGSQNLLYRGLVHAPFYLIGGGEVLRFLWTGTAFLVLVLGQPGQTLSINMTNSNGAVQNGSGGSQYCSINAITGSPGLFNLSSAQIAGTVPVSGLYSFGIAGYFVGTSASYAYSTLLLGDSITPSVVYVSGGAVSNNAQGAPLTLTGQITLKQGAGFTGIFNAPTGTNLQGSFTQFGIKLIGR